MAKRGLGVLSWKGYESLRTTLTRLCESGVADLFDERFVFFPEIDDEGRRLAAEFDFDCDGSAQNLGIFGGFRALAKSMKSDTVLLLENDLQMFEAPAEAERQLGVAFGMIEANSVQVVCLRHRREPGDFGEAYRKFRRYFPEPDAPIVDRVQGRLLQTIRPSKGRRLIGHAPYVLENPEEKFEEIKKDPKTGFWIMSTAHKNWSNLAILVDRRFYTDVLMAYVEQARSKRRVNGFKNIEIELNSNWWRKQPWKVAVAPGLFTHHRTGYRGY